MVQSGLTAQGKERSEILQSNGKPDVNGGNVDGHANPGKASCPFMLFVHYDCHRIECLTQTTDFKRATKSSVNLSHPMSTSASLAYPVTNIFSLTRLLAGTSTGTATAKGSADSDLSPETKEKTLGEGKSGEVHFSLEACPASIFCCTLV